MSFKGTMNIFKGRRKSFKISDRDPAYKVRYLGNVQTSMMKGDGCVDKPTGILWNNFLKTATGGLPMKLCITSTGLKAYTKEQGLTEYRAHRISYCIAHPSYPKLFVWVYRHEGKKMKVELRCHAVLCKSEEKAKAMAVQLHEKLSFALKEFVREKTRRQNTRLTLQRTNSLPSSGTDVPGMPLRRKLLTQAGNYKTPIDRSPSAPKLGSISEAPDQEDVIEEEDEEEDDEHEEEMMVRRRSRDDSDLPDHRSFNGDMEMSYHNATSLTETIFDIEIGNDVEALKQDEKVRFQLESTHSDDDEDSTENTGSVSSDSESGFSEQDVRESSSSGSTQANTPDLRSMHITDDDDITVSGSEDVTIVTVPFVELDDASDTTSERSTHDDDVSDISPSHINGDSKSIDRKQREHEFSEENTNLQIHL